MIIEWIKKNLLSKTGKVISSKTKEKWFIKNNCIDKYDDIIFINQ